MTIFTSSIAQADCTRFLPQLPSSSINVVLTGHPYLVGYKSRDGRSLRNDINHAWLKPAFKQIHCVLKTDAYCISFYGWPHCNKFVLAWREAGFRSVGHLIFLKGCTSSVGNVRAQHESAYLLAKGNPKPKNPVGDMLNWAEYSGNKLHPTEKPSKMLLPLIENYSPEGGIVLDPFAGSSSTLVAAQMLGRSYISVELDARYHATARKRLEQLGTNINDAAA